jgi:hypothetical protein
MYQQLQDLLTFAIEMVAIIGYGGILAHYIINQVFSAQSKGELADFFSTVSQDTVTLAGNIEITHIPDTANTEQILNLPYTLCTLPQLAEVDQLTLRQCRAVIRSINSTLPKNERIRLKLNNKDAPASVLREQIKNHLNNRLQQVEPALEEILKVS